MKPVRIEAFSIRSFRRMQTRYLRPEIRLQIGLQYRQIHHIVDLQSRDEKIFL